uniref:Beta'-coat protein n=1 Tax=Oncorhynchus mykiss TaxID=8022 RepID=A0A8K9V8K6_ONCMY
SEFCNILTFSTLSPFTFSCPSLWYFQDDMQIHVFNYNTLERAHMFDAHSDYIRCIAVHPTQPYQQKWLCSQVFEGHTHYVMQIVINPKDNNQLSSASLDSTIKVWQLGSSTPNFTLEGHEKGVNYMCVQTLEGHTQNVSCVSFHPELPIILTGSEHGTVRVWHSSTYRLENTLNYGMERVWCVCSQRSANSVALGYDEGIWCQLSLSLAVKDMGSCEIYPQTIQHNPNGRSVCACVTMLYSIYTHSMNKSFGSAQECVWGHDSSELMKYATRESTSMVKIFKNFKQKKSFKPDSGSEAIQPSSNPLPTDIQPSKLFPTLVCIATVESFFMLLYLAEKVATAQETKKGVTKDGIEDSFEVLCEIQEVVKTGLWVGDCFIYTSSVNKLNYYVGGEIVTIAHLDRTMYLLGYIPKGDRLYLGDKELNIVTYSLLVAVLEYQTAVMRRDFGMADRVLPTIPKEMRTRVAHFLEKQVRLGRRVYFYIGICLNTHHFCVSSLVYVCVLQWGKKYLVMEEFIPAVQESIPVTLVEPTMTAVEESIEMAEEGHIIVEVEAPKPEELTAVEDTIMKIEVPVTIENYLLGDVITETHSLAQEVPQSTPEEEVITTPEEAVEEEPAAIKHRATDEAPDTESVTEPIVTEAPVAEAAPVPIATEPEPVTI